MSFRTQPPEPPAQPPTPPSRRRVVVLEPPPLAERPDLLAAARVRGGIAAGLAERSPPELVGEAVALLLRPLGGVEGAPALLRLTDTGWAELEKGRA